MQVLELKTWASPFCFFIPSGTLALLYRNLFWWVKIMSVEMDSMSLMLFMGRPLIHLCVCFYSVLNSQFDLVFLDQWKTADFWSHAVKYAKQQPLRGFNIWTASRGVSITTHTHTRFFPKVPIIQNLASHGCARRPADCFFGWMKIQSLEEDFGVNHCERFYPSFHYPAYF